MRNNTWIIGNYSSAQHESTYIFSVTECRNKSVELLSECYYIVFTTKCKPIMQHMSPGDMYTYTDKMLCDGEENGKV